MKYFQEITLIPDEEATAYFLWSKLYTQLHVALADVKNKYSIDGIGVSFPNYRYEEKNGKAFGTLGNKLRIFAPTEAILQTLDLVKRLDEHQMTDYVYIKAIRQIPEHVAYVRVRRIRAKSLERKIKDYAKYEGISYEEAKEYCQQHKKASLMDYPYVQLKSLGNRHHFNLSVIQEEVTVPISGKFNTYGINSTSGQTTVPHW